MIFSMRTLDSQNRLHTCTNKKALEAALWETPNLSPPHTVQGMFNACSFGRAAVSKASGVDVLRTPVPVPCGGATPQGQGYQSSSCPFNGAPLLLLLAACCLPCFN
jgi:hypothetical protein